MSSIVIDSRTGPDGVLHLDVPLGAEQANLPVRVVIEPARKPMTQEEWGGLGAVDGREHHRSQLRAPAATSPGRAGAAVVKYLLDTNTCIGWLRQNRPAIVAHIQAHLPADVVTDEFSRVPGLALEDWQGT